MWGLLYISDLLFQFLKKNGLPNSFSKTWTTFLTLRLFACYSSGHIAPSFRSIGSPRPQYLNIVSNNIPPKHRWCPNTFSASLFCIALITIYWQFILLIYLFSQSYIYKHLSSRMARTFACCVHFCISSVQTVLGIQ